MSTQSLVVGRVELAPDGSDGARLRHDWRSIQEQTGCGGEPSKFACTCHERVCRTCRFAQGNYCPKIHALILNDWGGVDAFGCNMHERTVRVTLDADKRLEGSSK